ncbi:MAG TPA: YsnF/AvaK domain-containing protein [Ktedonobacterales bacterium]|jgi:uncharacterized protein (TIGR02271 family)
MSVFPGAMVRNEGGEVGRIERVEPGSVLVRSSDGRAVYRFPMDLVEIMVREGDEKVATVSVSPDEVRQYEIDDKIDDAIDSEAAGGADNVIARPAAISDLPADGAAATEPGVGAGDEVARIPLVAESLEIEHRPLRLGTVRIHKGIQTGEQRVNVPIEREDIVVERIPANQFDASAPTAPDEIVIPLLEERLVVQKRQVITEYVRIRKRPVIEERAVSETLRREYVEVERRRADADPTGEEPPRGRAEAESTTPVSTTRKRASRKRGTRKSNTRARGTLEA